MNGMQQDGLLEDYAEQTSSSLRTIIEQMALMALEE
jgi:hypothetical protein